MTDNSLHTWFLALVCLSVSVPLAAQSPRPSYQISCQPREEFVSRLRRLVREPDAVEVALTRFSIVVSQDGERSWSLLATRTDSESQAPRTVRDRSCEAVAEAAALVISAWIDDTPLRAALPPRVTVSPPRAPNEDPQPPDECPKDEAKNGVAFGLENASALAPHWSLGTTVELWHQNADNVFTHSVGLTLWPTSFGLRTDTTARYLRPDFDLSYVLDAHFVHFGPVALGLSLALYVGWRHIDSGYDARLRAVVAFAVRWNVSGPWLLYLRVGPTALTPEEKENGQSVAVPVGLNITAGVRWTLF
jgi:hypothetical protein